MEIGSLFMKPNFKEMSFYELRAYIIAHRTDDEAIQELFVNRRNPNTNVYPYEQTQEELEEIIKRKISEIETEL